MIYEEVKNDAILSSGIVENKVNIDTKNIDFITTLLTKNLYSDPLLSFLRETISNAVDSHKEAGTDEYILLLIEGADKYTNYNYLYTKLPVKISIRDYGTGVSHERFEEIYRNIGSSTKRESNDFIGMFGIGRFSCLFCADTANITSYYNGKKYSYLMYKNDSGINIDLVNTVEGQYKNGLEVSVTVKTEVNNIINKIKYLQFFDKLHIELAGDFSDELKTEVSKLNNKNIKIFNSFACYDSSLAIDHYKYIKMGSVLYEVNVLDVVPSQCFATQVLMDVPMGSIDITPSRENVQLTEKTKNTIISYNQKIKKELSNLISDDVKNIKTFKTFYDRYIQNNFFNLKVDNISLNVEEKDITIPDITIEGVVISENERKQLIRLRDYDLDKHEIYYSNMRYETVTIHKILSGVIRLIIKKGKISKQCKNWLIGKIEGFNAIVINEEKFNEIIARINVGFNGFDIKKYIELVGIEYIQNSDCPDDYKINKDFKIKVRKYGMREYCNLEFDSYKELVSHFKGCIVYGKHTKEDGLLRKVSSLGIPFINVISFKENDLNSLVFTNRKFIPIEEFESRNKIFEKISESEIIKEFYENLGLVNKVLLELNLFYKFKEKYKNYYIKENLKIFKEIKEDYVKKQWVKYKNIEKYLLTDDESKILKEWDECLINPRSTIKNMIKEKYGIHENISLT